MLLKKLLLLLLLTLPLVLFSQIEESPNQKFLYDHLGRIIYSEQGGRVEYPADDSAKDSRLVLSELESALANSINMGILSDVQLVDSPVVNGEIVSFNPIWRAGITGYGIGSTGFVTEDIDNDGDIECVMGGSYAYWYVLEYDVQTEDYGISWMSPYHAAKINVLSAFDFDNDGLFQILSGLNDGLIEVYDGDTLEKSAIINAGSAVKKILYADADNDGKKEMLVLTDSKILLYEPENMVLESVIDLAINSIPAANDMEVGNVDEELNLEILLSNGYVLKYDGVSLEKNRLFETTSKLIMVDSGDINGDAIDEIIVAPYDHGVAAFSGITGEKIGFIKANISVDALYVDDIDADGKAEVLYGDDQWGSLYCYDILSGAEKWQIKNPDHGVTNIGVADTDNDGKTEIFWGAGESSSAGDYLFIYDLETGTKEWQNVDLSGPFFALDIGDVDADGDLEIVCVSNKSDGGYEDGIVSVYDAVTRQLEWQSGPDALGGLTTGGVHDVEIKDLDGDQVPEIIVATSKTYDGLLCVFDGITHEQKLMTLFSDYKNLTALSSGDVDNDGESEIIIANNGITVVNSMTGYVEWSIGLENDITSEITVLKALDLDNDGQLEIVALANSLYVIKGPDYQLKTSMLTELNGLDFYDVDSDNIIDIITTDSSGSILVIDSQTLELKNSYITTAASIASVRVVDLQNDGNLEFVLGCSDYLYLYSSKIDGIIWQSEFLNNHAGSYDNIRISDINQDSFPEILVGTGHGVIQFEAVFLPDPDTGKIFLSPSEISAETGSVFTHSCFVNTGKYHVDTFVAEIEYDKNLIQPIDAISSNFKNISAGVDINTGKLRVSGNAIDLLGLDPELELFQISWKVENTAAHTNLVPILVNLFDNHGQRIEGPKGEAVKVYIFYPQGDINHSGKIDLEDAELLAAYLSKGELVGDESLADLDKDGKIGFSDLIKLTGLALDKPVIPLVDNPPEGKVSLITSKPKLLLEQTFNVELWLDSGAQNLKAFDFILDVSARDIEIQAISLAGEYDFAAEEFMYPNIVRLRGFFKKPLAPSENIHLANIQMKTRTKVVSPYIKLRVNELLDSTASRIPGPVNVLADFEIINGKVGDVIVDNKVDILDALIVARAYVGIAFPDKDAELRMDVNNDNKVDILDALLIARYYVGLISELPAWNLGARDLENIAVVDDYFPKYPDTVLENLSN
ncbi:MAG: hypothetical protein JXR70_08840 [Spirochaetales bacterium]|nr:hypothetical protein [Spirochaetales bacterium]